MAGSLCKAMNGNRTARADGMNFKWLGPLACWQHSVIGDQIRINRPVTNIG